MVNLSNHVGEIELRLDGVQLGMDAMRNETNDIRGELRLVVEGFASMREQFEWMRARWEEMERERKSKEKLGESSPGEFDSEVVLGIGERRAATEGPEGAWRPDSRGRKLEMPLFEGDDPDGWIF